ncbi:MAG: hypothetical protein ACJ8IK_08125 [Burkholderiaceae bacterium]|jgi:hypothetical protein
MASAAARVILPWLLAAACGAASAAPTASLRHVAKGMTSEATSGNAFLVIHTADDLATALNPTASLAAARRAGDVLASVDFDKEIVVGVMLSTRPTGCTGVDITSVTQDGIVSVVHYRARKPRKGEACQGRPYSPFDFVAIERTNAPFRFTEDTGP